jgi:hypothetical protein
MKKTLLALALTSVVAFSNETTIDATMKLMDQGLNQVQKGFIYNFKGDIMRGIETIESANSIFTHVDVSTFIKNNNKIQVTRNINENLKEHLKELKQDILDDKYSDAGAKYAKVLNDCVSCHTIIRGW